MFAARWKYLLVDRMLQVVPTVADAVAAILGSDDTLMSVMTAILGRSTMAVQSAMAKTVSLLMSLVQAQPATRASCYALVLALIGAFASRTVRVRQQQREKQLHQLHHQQ
jgi:hypothetical protein